MDMAEQRIPRPDADFEAWGIHYYEAVKKFWDDQGLDPNDLKPLEEAQAAWSAAFAKSVQAEAAFNSALEGKRDAREVFESAIRPISAFIQTYFKTTNTDRATIGITVRDTSNTPRVAPATSPLVSIKLGDRLKHTLRISDSATPRLRGKPPGVMGCEVWLKLVDYGQTQGEENQRTLGDPATFTFLGVATRSPHVTEFPVGTGGKQAVYMLRWVSTRGAPGPWSEVASGTVAA